MGAPTFFTAGVGVLAPFLLREFSLSRGQLGLLVTLAYLVAAGSAPWAGRVADGMRVRDSLLLLFAVAALALGVLALAPSYAVMILAAVVAGFGEAANTPVTNRFVARAFAGGNQGLLVGVKQSGVKVSHLVAGAALPTAALAWGWRPALLIGVAAGVLGIALTLGLVGPGSVTRPRREAGPRARVDRRIWVLSAYAGLMAVGQAPVQLYLPLFGVEAVGLGVREAGLTLALSSLAAVVARVAWGAVAGRLRSLKVPLVSLAAGSVLSVLAIWAAERAGAAPLWIGAVGFGLTAAVWSTLVHLSVVRDARSSETGWASGIVHMAFLAGLALSPPVFGVLVDVQGSYAYAWPLAAVAFLLAGLVVVRAP
jgi:predicted MFS family arabinose efflux permease